jgi:hypothetical protein
MSFQTDYDKYRQGVYDQGAAIVARYNSVTDVTGKQSATNDLASLMNSFDQQTKAMVAAVPIIYGQQAAAQSYALPRFHDYYDFFQKIIASWQSQLGTMAAVSGAVGATTSGQQIPIGCTAGICGPVPTPNLPTTPITAVPTGAPNAQGVTSVAVSGGSVSVGSALPLMTGGLAPSPYSSDLPGAVAASSATPPDGNAVLAAGVPSIPGTFNLKDFLTSKFALVAALLIISVLLLKNAKVV